MRYLALLICALAAVCRGDDEIVDEPAKVIASADKITEILTIHNNLRKNEGASNMKALKWNAVLAQMADAWANNCDFSHGQPATPASPFPDTGQNLYAKSPAPSNGVVNYTAVTQKWFDEKPYYDFATQGCSKVCGHYTQVVWANTAEIGCAAAVCPTLKSTTWTNALLVVCNYGPAGNWDGEDPYKKGTACGDCPSSCTNGLCN